MEERPELPSDCTQPVRDLGWHKHLPLGFAPCQQKTGSPHTAQFPGTCACGFTEAGRRLSRGNVTFPGTQGFDVCARLVFPLRFRLGRVVSLAVVPRERAVNLPPGQNGQRKQCSFASARRAALGGRRLCALPGSGSRERGPRTPTGLSTARTAPPRSSVPREAIPRKKQEPCSLETLN